MNDAYLRSCQRGNDSLCPIFRLGDVVRETGEKFSVMAVEVGLPVGRFSAGKAFCYHCNPVHSLSPAMAVTRWMFSVYLFLRLSLSCERNIRETSVENIFQSGTNVHVGSRMNRLEFGGQRSLWLFIGSKWQDFTQIFHRIKWMNWWYFHTQRSTCEDITHSWPLFVAFLQQRPYCSQASCRPSPLSVSCIMSFDGDDGGHESSPNVKLKHHYP